MSSASANTRDAMGRATAAGDGLIRWEEERERAPEKFPTDIPEPVVKEIKAAAIDACKALRILDYGRVDMRLRRDPARDGEWEFFVIEANPNPYLDHRDLLPRAAERDGKDYPALLEHIIELATTRTLRGGSA